MAAKTLIKKNIKANLPYGGLSKIARALLERTGRKISVSQIRNICSPDKNSWDVDVIQEAQRLILAEQAGIVKAKENLV